VLCDGIIRWSGNSENVLVAQIILCSSSSSSSACSRATHDIRSHFDHRRRRYRICCSNGEGGDELHDEARMTGKEGRKEGQTGWAENGMHFENNFSSFTKTKIYRNIAAISLHD
jgi:hypothetical protein